MSGYSTQFPSWDRPVPDPISDEQKKILDAELDKYMGRGRVKRFRKSRRHNKSRRRNKSRRHNKSKKTKRIR
jgi:hypothetical protein